MGETSGAEAMRALALVLIAVLVAGCASPIPSATAREYVPVTGFTDVHGIAVDPEDPDVLYVATHSGLVRGKDGAWARVGGMQDDLMGFSMHPDDNGTSWTSGHPKGGGNMGVRQSTDGGFTWTQLSLDGVDFHAMAVSPADPDVVWGAWRGSIYHSTDGARTWQTYAGAPAARTLAAHPAEKDTLFATTQAGIERSTDAGRTWGPFADVPAFGLAIAASDPGVLYAGIAGGVTTSMDGGATWRALHLRTSAPVGFLAIHPGDASEVWAATYAAGIHRTTDGGETWSEAKIR